jgi:hypothetical protein
LLQVGQALGLEPLCRCLGQAKGLVPHHSPWNLKPGLKPHLSMIEVLVLALEPWYPQELVAGQHQLKMKELMQGMVLVPSCLLLLLALLLLPTGGLL